jgi:hypothetical protein
VLAVISHRWRHNHAAGGIIGREAEFHIILRDNPSPSLDKLRIVAGVDLMRT